jgi:hypothetical protein
MVMLLLIIFFTEITQKVDMVSMLLLIFIALSTKDISASYIYVYLVGIMSL